MRISLIQSFALSCLMSAASALELGRPFSSHMVLPHDVEFSLHGKAGPGKSVTLTFADQQQTATCDPGGHWRIRLAAMKPSSIARNMEIVSGDQKIVLEDVLVGEVWLCSGQSNMDFPLQSATGAAEALQSPASAMIRFCSLSGLATSARPFVENDRERLKPGNFFQGTWHTDEPKLRGKLSAVAWWFAQQRQRDVNMPIGIVENAVGGSGTEAWISPNMLQSRADYADFLSEKWRDHPKISAWARQRARLQTSKLGHCPHPFQPGYLYEAGIASWQDFPFTAALWYQGETNAEIPDIAWNSRLLEDLMASWRQGLRHPKMPFFIVELPRIGGTDPLRQYWPQYREAQRKAVASSAPAYRIETIDLGWDSPDVHPPDKKPLALRAAAEVKKHLPH
jgi:sialate O-acetylesterase